jgi:hypothetical protein
MARRLSRKGRICLAFAAVGFALVGGIVGPKLPTAIGVVVALAAIFEAIWRIRKRAAEERAAFELSDRIVHRDDNTAQAAEKTDTTTTKERCLHCQHVQTVPVSQETYSCQQCKARLKRRTVR